MLKIIHTYWWYQFRTFICSETPQELSIIISVKPTSNRTPASHTIWLNQLTFRVFLLLRYKLRMFLFTVINLVYLCRKVNQQHRNFFGKDTLMRTKFLWYPTLRQVPGTVSVIQKMPLNDYLLHVGTSLCQKGMFIFFFY